MHLATGVIDGLANSFSWSYLMLMGLGGEVDAVTIFIIQSWKSWYWVS